jgi:hypothetical protein
LLALLFESCSVVLYFEFLESKHRVILQLAQLVLIDE